MVDSPRASKRRKLDTPRRVTSCPVKPTSTIRKSSSKVTSRKSHGAALDVWDDLEGALGQREPTTSVDELQSIAVQGDKHGVEAELDMQKDIAARAATPPQRTAQSRPARRLRRNHGEEWRNDTLPTTPATAPPKKSKRTVSRGTAAASTRSSKHADPTVQQSAVPDSEDELGDPPPSSRKGGNARRKGNRADHFSNDVGRVETSEDTAEVDPAATKAEEHTLEVDGNSVSGSVLDPTEPSPFNKPASARKEQSSLPLLDGHFEPGSAVDLLKTIVMERITAKRPVPLVGLEEEYKTVHQLIEHTITAGEGNSLLLIGARGSGKSALVSKILTEISKDNKEDFHIVRLNGFIHTDDKIALREIWRQLGKEMELEEEGGGVGKNYADTLTTLLALLSHPSEHTGEVTDQVAKAVIFVMDEFDLFAQHPRQTLLYNLLDIAQSRKAPIAVLGLTTRIDVTNSLEKRVKSRFSHRYVHLSLAKSFTAFQEICKANLIVLPEHLNVEERGILSSAAKPVLGKKAKKGAKQDIISAWNTSINALFASKAFLTNHLAPHFYLTKSVSSLLTTLLLPTATLFPSSALVVNPSISLSPPDSKLALVPHLSTLALALLIAAARLDIIHDSDTCNFNMCYDEYVTLASKARIQSAAGGTSASGGLSKVWGKEVARREWERLVELGLIMPVVGGGLGIGGFGMVRCDVSLEELGAVLAGEKGIERGLERWCRQI